MLRLIMKHGTPVIGIALAWTTLCLAEKTENESNWPHWRGPHLTGTSTSGEIVWQTKVHEAIPSEGGHNTGTLASASPTTDGVNVYAFFGSQGLYCLDIESGEVKWSEDFGDMQTKHGHGEGSSPILFDDKIFVNWDHEGLSFIGALDKETGKKTVAEATE